MSCKLNIDGCIQRYSFVFTVLACMYRDVLTHFASIHVRADSYIRGEH